MEGLTGRKEWVIESLAVMNGSGTGAEEEVGERGGSTVMVRDQTRGTGEGEIKVEGGEREDETKQS